MSNGDNPVAGRRVAKESHEVEGWVKHGLVEHYKTINGLTKREHFAGLAMQGMLANSGVELTCEERSKYCVMSADAILKELES